METEYHLDLTAKLKTQIAAVKKAEAKASAAMRRIPMTIDEAVDAQAANAAHTGKGELPFDPAGISNAIAGHRGRNLELRSRLHSKLTAEAHAAILDKAIELVEVEVKSREAKNAEMMALGARPGTDLAGPLREKLRSLRCDRARVDTPGQHCYPRAALHTYLADWPG